MTKSEFLKSVAEMVTEFVASASHRYDDAGKLVTNHGFSVLNLTQDPVVQCVMGLYRFQTLRTDTSMSVTDHVRIYWILEKAWESFPDKQ